MARAVAVRFVGEVEVEDDDAEAAARSRRAVGRCTREAKAVAEVFLERIAIVSRAVLLEHGGIFCALKELLLDLDYGHMLLYWRAC